LERAFQKRVQNVPQPINIIEQDWSKKPWIRGVPCPFTPPGVLTSDAGKAIRVPVGNLHFVGTETAFVWKGYMEGAVRSGTKGDCGSYRVVGAREDVSFLKGVYIKMEEKVL
jgi:monoamine oxidase